MTGVSCSWVGNDSEDAGLVCKRGVVGRACWGQEHMRNLHSFHVTQKKNALKINRKVKKNKLSKAKWTVDFQKPNRPI